MNNMRTIKIVPQDIERNLPQIDGVQWKVDMYELPNNHGVQVQVRALITITPDWPEPEMYVLKRVHQITSGGQQKLEIERFDKQ